MPAPRDLDGEARAELLCYLVVTQIVAQARTAGWATVHNLVESARIWLHANSATCDWPERLELATASLTLAPQLAGLPFPKNDAALAEMFADRWQLDYRSPVVRGLYDACAKYLARP